MVPGRSRLRCLSPKGDTAVFQPLVQLIQILKDRHNLPHAIACILDVLLDLAFLPACRWIAELWFKNIVTGHRFKTRVDVTLFATANAINWGLHVVIDTAPGHAAEHAERMPMGIEQHLMGLQWIGAHQKSPAVRELRMGHLKLDPFATE